MNTKEKKYDELKTLLQDRKSLQVRLEPIQKAIKGGYRKIDISLVFAGVYATPQDRSFCFRGDDKANVTEELLVAMEQVLLKKLSEYELKIESLMKNMQQNYEIPN